MKTQTIHLVRLCFNHHQADSLNPGVNPGGRPPLAGQRRGILAQALLVLACIALLGQPARAASTEFTYQGQLKAGSALANGGYDLQFGLFDAATSGTQIGSTVATSSVSVSNGLFTVSLDFGVKAFSGPDRWLEISVRPTGVGGYATLSSRQKLTATPYALALPNLRTEASQNTPSFLSANVIGGATSNTVAVGVSGAVIAGGGSTGGFPQQISANYSNIGGGYSNTITVTGQQSVIAGGVGNSISNVNAVIGGGTGHSVSGLAGTVGGGQSNTASANGATVPGGLSNTASGAASFAAGNRAKAVHAGAFVWGDSTAADVSSTANDQMMIRANGGVVLNTNANVAINAATGMTFSTDATNATIVPVGTAYRDNTIIAWGRVSSNALSDAFNVSSVVRNSAGNYTVTLRTTVSGTALVPVASISYPAASQPTTAATYRMIATDQLLSNNTFIVFTNSGLFAAADADFTFIVTGR